MATLLIVEDDQGCNEAVCEYLQMAGHRLLPAYDGATALQIFAENNVDLVVLDIMLPKLSGLAVLRAIRRQSKTPVLMLTALEDEYTQLQSFVGAARNRPAAALRQRAAAGANALWRGGGEFSRLHRPRRQRAN